MAGPDNLAAFARELNSQRKDAGISYSQLTAATAAARSSLSDWFNGKCLIPLEVLKGLLKLCGASSRDQSIWVARRERLHEAIERAKRDKSLQPTHRFRARPVDIAGLVLSALAEHNGNLDNSTIEISIKVEVTFHSAETDATARRAP